MRIAIIGAGALGTFYGARLQAAGHEVHLLARSDAAIGRAQGFTCHSVLGTVHIPGQRVHAEVKKLPQCDVVIVALKTTDNAQLPELLPPALAADGMVLVLQNGLGVEAEAAAVVGAERVAGGLCFLCANKVAPATVEHLAHGKIALGQYHAQGHDLAPSAALRAIANALQDGGIEIEVSDNLAAARWRKLCWNIPYNGLCTVLNCDTQVLASNPAGRQAVDQLMREVQRGAAACGHHISDDFLQVMVNNTDEMGPYLPSMTIDRRHGRAMEIEHMFGQPLADSTAAGTELPLINQIYHQLKILSTQQIRP